MTSTDASPVCSIRSWLRPDNCRCSNRRTRSPERPRPSASLVAAHRSGLALFMRLAAALLFSLVSTAALAQDCSVLLHGLARTETSFLLMQETLKSFDYAVVSETYPSVDEPIEELIAYVDASAAKCGASERIHFVTHSMGGILLR